MGFGVGILGLECSNCGWQDKPLSMCLWELSRCQCWDGPGPEGTQDPGGAYDRKQCAGAWDEGVSRASHTAGPPARPRGGDLRAQILAAGAAEVTLQGSHSLGVCPKTAVDSIHMQVIL